MSICTGGGVSYPGGSLGAPSHTHRAQPVPQPRHETAHLNRFCYVPSFWWHPGHEGFHAATKIGVSSVWYTLDIGPERPQRGQNGLNGVVCRG